MSRLDLHRPMPVSASGAAAAVAPSTPPSPSPAKPKGGARVLSFILQAVVMAIALALFFIFAGVAAVILLHLFVAGRALRHRRGSGGSRQYVYPDAGAGARAHDAPAPPGLSAPELKKLPWFRYPGCSAAPWRPRPPPPADCAVCLDGFRERERCRALPPCGHVFHAQCIDRWLVRAPACPICRARVVAAPAMPKW